MASLTCCCCIQLRTGALVLASLKLAEGVVGIFFSAIFLASDPCWVLEDTNTSLSFGYDTIALYDCWEVTEIWRYVMLTGLVLACVGAITCISYIVGAVKNTPLAMVPLVIWEGIRLGLLIVLVGFLVYWSVALSDTSLAPYIYFITAFVGVYSIIFIYFTYVLELYFKLVRRIVIDEAMTRMGQGANTTSVTVQQDVRVPAPGYAPPGYAAPTFGNATHPGIAPLPGYTTYPGNSHPGFSYSNPAFQTFGTGRLPPGHPPQNGM